MVNSSVIKDKNLITISFGDETRVTVLDKLYQHDKGQILQFKDIPDGAQVEFSNSKMEKSIPEIVKDGAVPVPNSIVAENETVDVRVKYIDENSETTVKEVKLFVINGKEADYEIDPENEQTFREEIEGILNETKEAAKEAADKVEVNRKYLDDMEKKSTDTIENITTVGEAQINAINEVAGAKINAIEDISKGKLFDINGTAQAQVDALNRTAQAQIEAINNVATKNIESETNSIVQVAQNQIAGINQVARGQIYAINDTTNRQVSAINETATSQIKAINDTAQAQSKALQEQGDGLKYDLAVKEKHTIMLSAGAYSDLIDVNEYDAIQVNSISCNGTDAISASLKLEVVKFKNGEQVGDEFLEKYNAIADLTDCDSIKLLVAYQGGISDVATVWYTLIVWDVKKEIERYVERVEDVVLIKPTASGTNIVIDDSSDMSIQELHLYGKSEQIVTTGAQLFDVNNKLNWNSVFSVDSEGWISAIIPANTGTTDTYYAFNTKKNDLLKPSTTYLAVMELGTTLGSNINIVGVSPNSGSGNKSQFQGYVNFTKSSVAACRTLDSFENSNVMCKGYIQVKPGFARGSVKFRFSLIEDTSMTIDKFKYEAYTGGKASPNPEYPQEIKQIENPTVSVVGKNLFDVYGDGKSKTVNGVTFNWNDDNSITIKGTATGGVGQYVLISFPQSETRFNNSTIGMNYTLKVFGLPKSCYLNISYGQKTYGENTYVMKNVAEYSKRRWTAIIVPEGVTINTTVYPMLVLGDTINEYEPYKPIQSIKFNYNLHGIEDNHDELVINANGTGKLIRRISEEKFKFKGFSESVDCPGRYVKINCLKNIYKKSVKGFCNIASYSDWGIPKDNSWIFGITQRNMYLAPPKNENYTLNELNEYLADIEIVIIAQLEEPIITDLTAEDVQKVLAINTYKPVTTIWNDQNADIEVTYVADAKNYIDNKLAEIQALTLEGGN